MARRSVLEDATFYLSGKMRVPFFELDENLYDLTSGQQIQCGYWLYQQTLLRATKTTLGGALCHAKRLQLKGAKTTKAAVLRWMRAIRRKAKGDR